MMIIKEARLETGGQRKTEDQRCSDFSGCWTELWWNRGERRAESASMASNDLCSPQPASVRHWTKECQARALPSVQPRQRNSSSLHSPSPYSPLLSPPSPPLYYPPPSPLLFFSTILLRLLLFSFTSFVFSSWSSNLLAPFMFNISWWEVQICWYFTFPDKNINGFSQALGLMKLPGQWSW